MRSFSGAFNVEGGLYDRGGGNEISVTVGRGTVNGYEPIVDGRTISGVGADGKMSEQGPPVVTGKAEFVDRRCYVCIKIRVDISTGKMPIPPSEQDLTIVISKFTKMGVAQEEGFSTWLHPIALFTEPYKKSTGEEVSATLHQISYFNLLHYVYRPKYIMPVLGFQAGSTDRLHHFLAGI